MLIPIGDDQVKGGFFPYFSYGFILINVLVYVYQYSLYQQGLMDSFIIQYGAIPAQTAAGENLISVLTSMFLHGSIWHLLGNMLFLWIFADNIESTIGNLSFAVYYLVGGIAAYLVHAYFNWGSTIPTVGASGAISAVMGTYLVMFPKSRVRMMFFFLIIFFFRIPAYLFLLFWAAGQTMSGIASLDLSESSTGIAYWAHIGGFAWGVLAGFYYRARTKSPERRFEERNI
jgi:membrane associated rhomboid family serine protease